MAKRTEITRTDAEIKKYYKVKEEFKQFSDFNDAYFNSLLWEFDFVVNAESKKLLEEYKKTLEKNDK